MKLADFLRGKALFFFIALSVAGFCAVQLYAIRSEPYFALFIPSAIIAGSIASVMPEYFVKRRFYRELESVLEQLDKRHLISEIIERPDFYEGEALCDALKAAGKSMNDEIAKYKLFLQEYKEYIELWVHEIKTPIAGAKLIGENAGNGAILEELDKIEFFVEQALYYARSDAVEKDCIIKKTELSGLVASALKLDAKSLISRKVSIQTENLDEFVYTDAKWVVFILRQIIANSVKYGGSRLDFFSVKDERGICLCIRDNGIGIMEKDLRKVFDKGFTGENGRKYGRSTGFGLYLCKKLCLRLGLGIEIASSFGEGATVSIMFPKNLLDS
ncbi:MAG: sensor histidine kinase [Clostridiales bacterium]|jgi:signal transduction histidine kinase|nr:sensor histidine kinase [Clostridiales bacterium]